MSTAWVLFVILAPAACAAAGALVAHLAHRGRCEQLQDRAYEDGWRDGRAKAEAFAGSMTPDYPTVVLHRPAPAHHARPRPSADASRADMAVLGIRSEFDRIRVMFGLDLIEGPARSRTAELHHSLRVFGPPSAALLRASGIDPGPPWPDRPGPE